MDLPKELVHYVLSNASDADIKRYSRVSHQAREDVKDEGFWKMKLGPDYDRKSFADITEELYFLKDDIDTRRLVKIFFTNEGIGRCNCMVFTISRRATPEDIQETIKQIFVLARLSLPEPIFTEYINRFTNLLLRNGHVDEQDMNVIGVGLPGGNEAHAQLLEGIHNVD